MEGSPYGLDNVRRGALANLTGRGIAALTSFAAIVLLVKAMAVRDYAGYTALLGLAMLAAAFAELGLDRAIARYVPEGRISGGTAKLRTFVLVTAAVRLTASLLLAATIFAAWPLILRLLAGSLDTAAFHPALACFICAAALSGHFAAVAQSLVQQKLLLRAVALQSVIRLAMILGLVRLGGTISLDQALWVMAVPEAIGAGVLAVLLWPALGGPNAASNDAGADRWPPWRQMFGMAAHNYAFNILAAAPQTHVVRLLAAVFLPPAAVAAYGFLASLMEKLRQFLPLQLVLAMAEPVLIARYLATRDFRDLNGKVQLLFIFNVAVLLPGLVIYSFARTGIVELLAGPGFVAYSWFFSVMLVQALAASHVALQMIVLNAVGASRYMVPCAIGSLGFMGAYLLLALRFDPLALLFAPLLYEVANNLLMTRAIRRAGFRYLVNAAGLGVFAAVGLAVSLVLWALGPALGGTPVSWIWDVLLGAALFSVGVLVLQPLGPADLLTLRRLVRRGPGTELPES